MIRSKPSWKIGQQTLEIVIFGYATPGEAEGAFRRKMEDLIRT